MKTKRRTITGTKIFPVKYCKRPKALKDVAIVFPISDEIAGILQLYALSHQQTLSNVTRGVCVKFIGENRVTVATLTDQLAAQAQAQWNHLQSDIVPNLMKSEFKAFQERVRYELEYRGVKSQYINSIISKIHI